MSHCNKKMLSFFLTTRCNLCCSYCYNAKERNAIEEKTLPLEIAKAGIDWYFNQNDSRHIRFYGPGEPTQEFERLKEITAYAKAHPNRGEKVTIEIQTNGVFTEDVRNWALDNFNIMWMSFDGMKDIQSHNRPLNPLFYGYSSEQAIGKRFLELFVAAPERNQAELECKKIIEGRSAPGEFINNMAVDFDSLGRDVTLMTNCFRIFDDESQKWLQAEIALPTDVEKVVQKHADILRNYQKLQSTIARYENDKKSFLESVGARVKDLTAVTRKILNSRRKSILQTEDIEKLDSLQSTIDKTRRKIIGSIDENLKIIQEAKSIEQCSAASDDYVSCKNVCRQMLDDIQDYLDDIVEELKVDSITHTIELNQARSEAIIESDAEGNTLLLRINNLIQIAFDTSDNLSFRSNNDIPRKKIEQYTSYVGDVQKLLSSLKAKISQCTSKSQIANCRVEFTRNLKRIEKNLDSNEESV